MSQHIFIHGHNLLTHKHCRWWCYHCDKVILICCIIYKVAAASEGSLCLLMCPGPGLVLGREERIRETIRRGPSRTTGADLVADCILLVSHPCMLFLVLLIHEKVDVCFQASRSTSELMLWFFLKAARQVARAQVSVREIWQHWRGVQWCAGKEVILCWMGYCNFRWRHYMLLRLY